MVKDASGTTIANAMIFAFSPSQGSGTGGQSDTSGKFSLNVTEGSYNVGAFFPGMGQSRELSVEVTSAASSYVFVDGSKTSSTGQTGANPFVLTIKNRLIPLPVRLATAPTTSPTPPFSLIERTARATPTL